MPSNTTGEVISVPLGDEWQARCRLVPRRGRPALVELHVCPNDGDIPSGEITHALLRKLRRSEIDAALARLLDTRTSDSTVSALYDDDDDELLALVAITYAEAVVARSPSPSLDVWEFLTDLHKIESASDWPWGKDGKVVKRAYERSSVRTLVRRARDRKYLLGDRLNGDSAKKTLERASRHSSSYDREAIKEAVNGRKAGSADSRSLAIIAKLRNQATLEAAPDPVEFVQNRIGRINRSKVESLLADARRAGYLIPSGKLMTKKAVKLLARPER
jgi:hypothetical protein